MENDDWFDLIGLMTGLIFCIMIIHIWMTSLYSNYGVIIYTNQIGEFYIEIIIFYINCIFLIILLIKKAGKILDGY